MAIYLCRWPNGDFSMSAKTKADAIELPDEWGNAEQALLSRMPDCMFDFRLRDDGQIELVDIGGSTHNCIMETCYPELDKAFASAEWDETGSGLGYSEKGHEQIRKAVELERTRLWSRQPPVREAETELGRGIQKQLGAASVVIDRIVREAARKRLRSKEGEGKEPN